MKTSIFKILSIFALILLTSSISFADGSVKVRKNCGWLSNKYASRAWVTKTIVLANQLQTVTTCNSCYPIAWGGEASVSLEDCAWQKARYCNGAFLSGLTQKWFCNRGGFNFFSHFQKYNLNISEDAQNSYERSEIQTQEIVFNTSSISVPFINGSLYTSDNDMETYFEVKLWICDYSKNDTVYNDLNTIQSGRLGIVNGQILREGILNNANVSFDQDGTESTIVINDWSLQIAIPESYMELYNSEENPEIDFVVELITHGGGNPEKSIDAMILQTQKTTVTNLVNLELRYDIDNSLVRINFDPISKDNYVIKIYDINGSVVEEFDSMNFKDMESVEILLDRSKFQKGIYMVTYEGNTDIKAIKMVI